MAILYSQGCGYRNSLINNFNTAQMGFTDYNILLSSRCGQNHLKILSFAPVPANTKHVNLDIRQLITILVHILILSNLFPYE
jgi:hypothetical protein